MKTSRGHNRISTVLAGHDVDGVPSTAAAGEAPRTMRGSPPGRATRCLPSPGDEAPESDTSSAAAAAGAPVDGPSARGNRLRVKALSGAFRALGRTTPWLEYELNGLRAVVRPGAVCVDAGAALGIYTAVLSDLVGPRGTVHSVEPLVFVHPVWNRLLRPRTGDNVRRHALALGATPGRTVMRVPVRNGALVTGRSFVGTGALRLGSNYEFDAHVDVAVRVESLDRLCEAWDIRRVDFIKVDVEGAELGLLAGARSTIEHYRPALLVEIEARHTCRYGYEAEAVVAWLTKRGYRMHAFDGTSWRRASRVVPHRSNYLFRHAATPVTWP